jgi:hypothetical protein
MSFLRSSPRKLLLSGWETGGAILLSSGRDDDSRVLVATPPPGRAAFFLAGLLSPGIGTISNLFRSSSVRHPCLSYKWWKNGANGHPFLLLRFTAHLCVFRCTRIAQLILFP